MIIEVELPSRNKRPLGTLGGPVVESRLFIYHGHSSIIGMTNDVLDNIVNEFDRRFSRNNMVCWKSMDVLIPNTETFLYPIVLKHSIRIPFLQSKENCEMEI